MAITSEGITKAEWTFCYERRQTRRSTGAMADELRRLPWAFVEFADAGEQGKRYVVPVPPQYIPIGQPANGVEAELGWVPYRQYAEYMQNQPFPHENGQGPRGAGDNAGPVALHFFGAV